MMLGPLLRSRTIKKPSLFDSAGAIAKPRHRERARLIGINVRVNSIVENPVDEKNTTIVYFFVAPIRSLPYKDITDGGDAVETTLFGDGAKPSGMELKTKRMVLGSAIDVRHYRDNLKASA